MNQAISWEYHLCHIWQTNNIIWEVILQINERKIISEQYDR